MLSWAHQTFGDKHGVLSWAHQTFGDKHGVLSWAHQTFGDKHDVCIGGRVGGRNPIAYCWSQPYCVLLVATLSCIAGRNPIVRPLRQWLLAGSVTLRLPAPYVQSNQRGETACVIQLEADPASRQPM